MAAAAECNLPNCSPCRIGDKQFVSVLVEGETVGYQMSGTQDTGRAGRRWAARCVDSGTTRRWCHGYRTLRQHTDVTPDIGDSENRGIEHIRHRLDTKNLFAVNCGRGSTVGSRAGYFPNSSLSRSSVRNPEISSFVEGDTVGSWNA